VFLPLRADKAQQDLKELRYSQENAKKKQCCPGKKIEALWESLV